MLCGRDRELRMVVRLLEDARAGRSGVLAVVGEAGIGKSALLGYAEEQAAGMKVLRARGVRSEARIPFAGLLELLRPALSCLPAIPGPQAEALQSALALRPARASLSNLTTIRSSRSRPHSIDLSVGRPLMRSPNLSPRIRVPPRSGVPAQRLTVRETSRPEEDQWPQSKSGTPWTATS